MKININYPGKTSLPLPPENNLKHETLRGLKILFTGELKELYWIKKMLLENLGEEENERIISNLVQKPF